MAKFYSALPLDFSDVEIPSRKHLARLSDDYHVCLEFNISGLESEDSKAGFDAVVIHERGIHVIEFKNHKRIVEGRQEDAKWRVRNDDGTPAKSERNLYNQAVRASRILKNYLISRSTEILDNASCTPFICSQALCNTHTAFWHKLVIFPYLCFSHWNRKNAIRPLAWCQLTQVSSAPLSGSPPDILEVLQKTGWWNQRETSELTLSPKEIAKLIGKLGCEAIDYASALGEVPLWRPNIDRGIESASRSEDIEALSERLSKEKIIAVVGEPKIGKSTVARLLGDRLQRAGTIVSECDFRMDEYSGRLAAEQLLERFFQLVRIPPQATLQDNIASFLGVLQTQQHLLIFDNFESALNDEGEIKDKRLSLLLERLINVSDSLRSLIVFTSIIPFRTQSHDIVPHYLLRGMSHEHALRYLIGCGWTKDESEQIYGMREGHSLALRLASQKIKQNMKPGIPFDVALDGVKPEIIDLTYRYRLNSFSADERQVVEILSLHYSGFDLSSIQFIAPRIGLKKNVASILAQLYERKAIESAGESRLRFSLLPQDQAYVYGQVAEPASLHEHAVECFRKNLEGHDSRPYPLVEEMAARVFFHGTRSGNLKAAFDVFMILRERPDMYDFPATITSMCSQLVEHRGFNSLSALDQGRVFQYAGRLNRHIGEIETAEGTLKKALDKFQEANEPVLYASTLSDLGLSYRKQGDYGRELELYQEALDLLGTSPDPDAIRARSYILGRKAQALQRKGTDPSVTFDCFSQAVALARTTGDKELLVTRLAMLGNAFRKLTRDYQAAIKYLTEAVQISEATEGCPELGGALSGLARAYENKGDLKQAHDLYARAIAETQENDLYGMLDRIGSLAHVYMRMGKFGESVEHYEQALKIADRVSNQKAKAENLAGLGAVLRTQAGRPQECPQRTELLEKAYHCHKKAVEIQESMQEDPAGMANRYQELGRTLLEMQQPATARRFLALGALAGCEARIVSAGIYLEKSVPSSRKSFTIRDPGSAALAKGENAPVSTP